VLKFTVLECDRRRADAGSVASRQEPVGDEFRSAVAPLLGRDGVARVVFPRAVDLEVTLGDSFEANAELLDDPS